MTHPLRSRLFKQITLLVCGWSLSVSAQALEVGQTAAACQNPIPEIQPLSLSRSKVCPLSLQRAEHSWIAVEVMSVFCSACLENMPSVRLLQEEFRSRVTIRYLSLDANENLVVPFIQRQGAQLQTPIALDLDRTFRRDWGISATPTFLIFSRSGKLVYKHLGTFSAANLREIRALLAQSY